MGDIKVALTVFIPEFGDGFVLVIYLFIYLMLGIKLRALCPLGMYSITKLHPRPQVSFINMLYHLHIPLLSTLFIKYYKNFK